MRWLKTTGLAILAAVAFTASVRAEDVLNRIDKTGKIAVGVSVTYPPFGYMNERGEIIGLTQDLLSDLASRLSAQAGRPVQVEKVPVNAQNRFQFLQQGRIDLLFSTTNDSPERRRIADIIDPGFFASGATVVIRRGRPVSSWKDLSGKTLCTQQGAFYNKPLAEKYNLDLVPYAGVPEQTQALLDDRCFASVDDDAHAASMLQDKEKWSGYTMPLQPEYVTPWVMAIPFGSPKLHAFLSSVIADWHKSGRIIEEEKKWNIAPVAWADEMHAKYMK